jgi:hypothetical protein
MTTLESLQPHDVLRFFEILSNIPRGSENEKQAADWVVNFAQERGLTAFQDDLHCVVVRKPGQGGLENAPTLILHGHLDMVCAKDEGVEIDFLNEPIKLVVDGDFIPGRRHFARRGQRHRRLLHPGAAGLAGPAAPAAGGGPHSDGGEGQGRRRTIRHLGPDRHPDDRLQLDHRQRNPGRLQR